MRYNELHRNSGKEHGGRIWIKTFDSHLKLLVNLGIVKKHEESRFKVFYKLVVPDDTIPVEPARKRHEFLSFIAEKIAEATSLLYPKQEEHSEKDIEKDLDFLLFSIMYIMEANLVHAIEMYGRHPAYSTFVIDEMVEFFRKNAREIATVVGQNSETELFFSSILERIMDRREEKCLEICGSDL
jgi:DNA-binding transcriptional ArsR family regulator